jgi:hypothetical protein
MDPSMKILKGMNDVTRKLVEESTTAGESLVISVNVEVTGFLWADLYTSLRVL